MRLRANDSALRLRLCFWLGSTALFMIQPKTQKHAYPYISGSHGIIHTFKNYFVTVFSVINFQFSANKQYPNRPLKLHFQVIKTQRYTLCVKQTLPKINCPFMYVYCMTY